MAAAAPLALEMTAFAREMLRLGRNDQPERLWRAWYGREIDVEELREWILPVWQAAEFPACLGQSLWLDLFAATGYVDDSGDEEWKAPPDPPTVYRGASVDRPRGFSWTWDFAKAEWFANRTARFGFPAAIFEVTLRRDMLLGVIGGVEGRTEREVIVNPRRLRGRWTPQELTRFDAPKGAA